MSLSGLRVPRSIGCLALAAALGAFWTAGCGTAAGDAFSLLGFPLFTSTGSTTTGGSTGGTDAGGFFGDSGSGSTDPCDESTTRKFIDISMRNLDPRDHIHYFLVLIALVQGELYPDGSVCPDDVTLYTNFGYTEIPDGQAQEFGDFCIVGPALIYFHESGRFRSTGQRLASAIAPAQGTSATFDEFFTSAGARVPVPDLIYFHNPGTGDGAGLRVSDPSIAPCDLVVIAGDAECQQDAFYYVDQNDLRAGSATLGAGAGRRVPSEIQGTGCECLGFQDASQQLAPSATRATNARCNEFLRGGRIEYAFIRDDRNPPIPQLVWRVLDSSGGVVHEFDPRADIP